MRKFYVDDVPNSTNVSSYIMKRTDWKNLMLTVKPRQEYPTVLCFDIKDFNADELTNDINEAMDIYGKHQWNTSEGPLDRYGGFSLVYNPYHIEDLDPHCSTLGTQKNRSDQYFHGNIENHSIIKNSYYDSYGFNTPTLASQHKSLGRFMDRSKRTRIRSRLAVIDARHHVDPYKTRTGWHRDEPIFENLRINIPIVTNQNYLFEIENHPPIHLGLGMAYSWDTDVPHRVFNQAKEESERIHLVLGFSPWWDYIPEEKAWVQNEFYGVKHPFDMLVDGDIFSGLRFRPDITIL
jgi:hypothetical protein